MLEAMIGGTPDKSFTYLGSLSEAEFMTYGDLTAALGPAFPFAKASGFKYFVFRRNGKRIIVPSHAIGLTAFKTVYEKGMLYGDGTIGPNAAGELSAVGIAATTQNKMLTIGSINYVVRLMKGVPGFTYSGLSDNPSFDPPTEWEDIYYNLYANSVSVPNPVVPAAEQATRVVVSGQGRLWMLVQGANITGGVKRAIGRGRLDVSSTTFYGVSQIIGNYSSFNIDVLSATGSVWHPIFEQA